MLPECTNITQIIQHYHNFVHYADSQRFRTYGVSPDRLIIPYRQMVNSLIDLAASNFEGQNYCHLVLKDPELSLLVDEIPNFFCKDVKVVCIVRDPRAVIASMIRVWQKKRAESWRLFRQSPSWTATGEYLQCIVRAKTLPGVVFNYYWRIHQSRLCQEGRIHFVSYERIIDGDEYEFSRLDDYLGYSCGRKGFGRVYLPFDKNDAAFSENYGKAINAYRGDFKKTLTKRQLDSIEKTFSGFNAKYQWW